MTTYTTDQGRLCHCRQSSGHLRALSPQRTRTRPRFVMARSTMALVVLACVVTAAVGAHSSSPRRGVGSRHLTKHSHRAPKKHVTYLNEIVVNLGEPNEQAAVALADRYGLLFKGEVSTLFVE